MLFTSIILGFYSADLLMTASLLYITQTRKKKCHIPPSHQPSHHSVSIIIPAYNEEKNIVNCLKTAVTAMRPCDQLIVVDDGSSDRTSYEVSNFFKSQQERCLLLKRPTNMGKVSALNHALSHAQGHFIVTIDADTMISPESIKRMIALAESQDLDAVASYLAVHCPKNIIQKLQAMEYQSLARNRLFLSSLRSLMMLPGAFHMIKKESLQMMGGYSSDTLAEDLDAALTILNGGGKIALSDQACGHTIAPASMKQLFHQRYRWTLGTIQAYFKHSSANKLQADSCYRSFLFPLIVSVYFIDLVFYFLFLPAVMLLLIGVIIGNQEAQWPIILLVVCSIVSSIIINAMLCLNQQKITKDFPIQLVHQLAEKVFSQFFYFPLICFILIKKQANKQVWQKWSALKS